MLLTVQWYVHILCNTCWSHAHVLYREQNTSHVMHCQVAVVNAICMFVSPWTTHTSCNNNCYKRVCMYICMTIDAPHLPKDNKPIGIMWSHPLCRTRFGHTRPAWMNFIVRSSRASAPSKCTRLTIPWGFVPWRWHSHSQVTSTRQSSWL